MDAGFAQTRALFPVRAFEAAWAADVKREIGDRSSGDPFPVKKIETRQTRTMLVVNVFNLSDK